LENELFSTAVVQQKQNLVEVGCRANLAGCFSVLVVDILQFSSGSVQVFNGCFAPTYTTRATGLLLETPILNLFHFYFVCVCVCAEKTCSNEDI